MDGGIRKSSATHPAHSCGSFRALLEGVRTFQRDVFPKQEVLFQQLATNQNPDYLFVTCADSRIDPCLITQTVPGELFICRNAGNIIPAFGSAAGGVSATIEYAVMVLGIKHIIICGHSDCGAMKGVLAPEKVSHLRTVSTWLNYGESARLVVSSKKEQRSEQQMLQEVTEQNVIAQLTNLQTHPSVAAGMHMGTLQIHGWIYDIESGNVRMYHPEAKSFDCINGDESLPEVAGRDAFAPRLPSAAQ